MPNGAIYGPTNDGFTREHYLPAWMILLNGRSVMGYISCDIFIQNVERGGGQVTALMESDFPF